MEVRWDYDRIFNRHRGPYQLCVSRPVRTKPGFLKGEWLPGQVPREEVVSEAIALLTDPRDSIVDVGVFSVREQQFVTIITQKDIHTWQPRK